MDCDEAHQCKQPCTLRVMDDYETDPVLHADEIHPTKATCSLAVFENSRLGLKPYVSFDVNVECEEIHRDDTDEFDGTLEINVDGLTFEGKSWKDLETFNLQDTECCTEVGGPEVSVLFDSMHRRMGQLTVQVLRRRANLIDLHIAISDDIDNLGLDSFSLDVTAEFLGVGGSLESKDVAVSDLIDLEGLVEETPGHWKIPQ